MAKRPIPTPEELRQLLEYNPQNGELIWRARGAGTGHNFSCLAGWNTRYAGKPAMTGRNAHGYRSASILGRTLLAHRVAWAIYYGNWPKGHIDHVNGDKTDNRIANLRDVTRVENTRNRKVPSNNVSGYIGVSWFAQTGKWRATITHDGKRISLGLFSRKEDALAARKAADAIYGYHPNHGRLIRNPLIRG